jgi:CheY-like chemotaxis protein
MGRVHDPKDDPKDNLRDVREQLAIVRTIVDELQRGDPSAETLHAQAIEESARLVSAMADLSRRRSEAPASIGREATAPAGRRRHVLLVEDDVTTRAAIARWLEPRYSVTIARDGQEGLERAEEVRPDMILTDVWMPRMNGIDMVKRIRERMQPPAIPVVFLTGQSAPESVVEGFSSGAMTYLVKPVDLELLDEEIRLALELRYGQNA